MYLIDTDILIYSLKGNENVIKNFRSHADSPKAISVISYGEMVFGAKKSQRVHENLAKVYRLREIFPILEVTTAIMDSFGELKAELQQNGVTVDDFDLLIGSTALSLGYTVVTNNARHFSKIPGLKVENWSI